VSDFFKGLFMTEGETMHTTLFRLVLIGFFLAAFSNGGQLAFGQEAFDADAATEAYLASVPAEDRAASDAYFEGGYWLLLWGTLYGIVTAWVLLHFGFSKKFREWGEKVSRFKFVSTFIFMLPYLTAGFILGLPWSIYVGFFREHQYGLATQTFGDWFLDGLKGLGISLIMVSLFIATLYWVINRWRKRWWLIGGAVSALFIMIVITISPVFIDPLFNDYKPLEEGPLRTEILSMAHANGVPADNVYWFDASRQTTRISANVSGMFGTTRIALNDNLLNGATESEILAVLGHEIGHYVTNLIIALVIPISLVIAFGFAFVNAFFDKANARFGARWGVRDIADPAGLPLLGVLVSVYFMAMTPVSNTIIRENERLADLYGLNAAREPDGFATTALKLSTYRKLDPSPLEEFVFYDHPSGRSRIQMAMEWKAENLGQMSGIEDLLEEIEEEDGTEN